MNTLIRNGLEESDIIEIRKLLLCDNLSINQIAAKFNVTVKLIEEIDEEN